MKFEKVLEYYEDLNERKAGSGPMKGTFLGLERLELLADRLGRPWEDIQFIHICGTNGKGSVAAYLSAIIAAVGIKAGTFTSPGVFSFTETVKINNKAVSKKLYADVATVVIDEVSKMEEEGLDIPTSFEIQVAVAYMIFATLKVKLAVVECGMGGVSDATNICRNTLVACICKIGLEHTQYLGKNLTEIAKNKAGIIKNNCFVVSAEQSSEVLEVIKNKIQLEKAIYFEAQNVEHENILKTLTRFDYRGMKALEIKLPGKHQISNAVLAIDVIFALREKGFDIAENAIRKGLLETVHPGRFEVISKNPVFVIDGAHNPDAALAFSEALEYYFTKQERIYIVGIFSDKNVDEVIKYVAGAKAVITFKPDSYRGLDAVELAKAASKYTPNVTSAGSVEEAVEIARLLANKDDVIAAFGSLSTLSKIKQIVAR